MPPSPVGSKPPAPNNHATPPTPQSGDLAVTWAGENLILCGDRAMHWLASSTLIVADIHFGKCATFRSAGIAMPAGSIESDLERLDALVGRYGARRLLVLGDFFHARPGRTPAAVEPITAWRARNVGLMITIVRGNHDRHAGDPPAAWNIEVIPDSLGEGPFLFVHDPADIPPGESRVALCGHIHPGVRLRDRDGRARTLPAFLLGDRRGLMPAFGTLTGRSPVPVAPSDRVYVTTPDAVVEIMRR